jgi:transposase-like protein
MDGITGGGDSVAVTYPPEGEKPAVANKANNEKSIVAWGKKNIGFYHPTHIPKLIRAFRMMGYKKRQIADALQVTPKTLNNWKKQYEAVRQALDLTKQVADAEVVSSLQKRALGYTVVEKQEILDDKGRVVKTRRVTKHIPGETVAMTFWLKNRDKANWNDGFKDQGGREGEVHVTFVLGNQQAIIAGPGGSSAEALPEATVVCRLPGENNDNRSLDESREDGELPVVDSEDAPEREAGGTLLVGGSDLPPSTDSLRKNAKDGEGVRNPAPPVEVQRGTWFNRDRR